MTVLVEQRPGIDAAGSDEAARRAGRLVKDTIGVSVEVERAAR